MKKRLLCFLLLSAAITSYTQSLDKIITVGDVKRIETTLAADAVAGRKAFTPAADKAADFIASEFKKNGLQPLKGSTGYKQNFAVVSSKPVSSSALFDSVSLDAKDVIVISSSAHLTVTPASGYKKFFINAGAPFRKEIYNVIGSSENLLVFVDTSFSKNFYRLTRFTKYRLKSEQNIVFVLGTYKTDNFKIEVKQELTEEHGSNVVGIIPGKSKKEESVIFSGHYDHLGIEKADGVDSIYNGANDDASGITAVIEIAKYYKAVKNNERTVVLVAFTAEELGGFGSQYFSKQIDAKKVAAMFNIEMIGTESKWGRNSAYITGFEKSDLGKILRNNLKKSRFNFYPDPYTAQELFYRSDNATLARLGVPAHTISTSKMDNEPNYHKASDEVKTLDLRNMTEIIKSIIISANSIVTGKDTPSRVQQD
jgi:Zn-dependent M28 family amino/carboxypeptidase